MRGADTAQNAWTVGSDEGNSLLQQLTFHQKTSDDELDLFYYCGCNGILALGVVCRIYNLAFLDPATVPNTNADAVSAYAAQNLNMDRILGRRPLRGQLRGDSIRVYFGAQVRGASTPSSRISTVRSIQDVPPLNTILTTSVKVSAFMQGTCHDLLHEQDQMGSMIR
jgi:hypothetical protein